MSIAFRMGFGLPPEWDDSRSDFWNNPRLWDGIDPVKQLCWMRHAQADRNPKGENTEECLSAKHESPVGSEAGDAP